MDFNEKNKEFKIKKIKTKKILLFFMSYSIILRES